MNLIKKPFVLTILIAVLLKPVSLQYIFGGVLDNVFNVLRIAAFVLIIVVYLFLYRKINRIITAVLLYQFLLLVSTIFAQGDFLLMAINAGTMISLCFLTEILSEQNISRFVKCLFTVLLVYCLINAVTVFALPDSLYKTPGAGGSYYLNWFLGGSNQHIQYIIPCIACAVIIAYQKHGRITIAVWLLTICLGASIVLSNSTTSIIGLLCFAALMLLSRLRFVRSLINYKFTLAVNILFFCGVVLLRLHKHFALFFEGNPTLGNRTIIWDLALNRIGQSPFFGNGIVSTSKTLALIGSENAQNLYLDILIAGGLLGILIIVFILIFAGKKHCKNSRVSYILSATIFTFSIMLQAESYSLNLFLLLQILLFHLDSFDEKRTVGDNRFSIVHQRLTKSR